MSKLLAEVIGESDLISEQVFTALEGGETPVRGRRFEECHFVECRFTEAAFRSCTFSSCIFERCDLSNLTVEGLRFIEVEFKDSKLLGVNWTQTGQEPLSSFSFEGCLLDYADFSKLKLPRLQLLRCSLQSVNFTGADLSGADLRDSDLTDATFEGTNLSNADLRGAHDYAIDIIANRVRGMRVSMPEALALLSLQRIRVE